MILNLLESVCKKLEQLDIPYMLSGSVAMSVYSVSRHTRDIDLVIDLNESNLPQFLSAFREGYYLNEIAIREDVRRKTMFNLIDHSTGYKIDFVVLKNNSYRQTEFQRRTKIMFGGIEIWMVSIEDLIISKLIWIQDYQSEIQQRDITNLRANQEIDREYLYFWIKELNLKTFDLL